MAVFLGQALATSIIQVTLDRLASPEVIAYIKGRKHTDELLQKLKVLLLSAKSVLIDAEEKQFTNPAVKNWLDELKDAVYVADDLLDEIATEALSKSEAEFQTCTSKVLHFVSTSVNSFDKKIRSRLEKVLGILQIVIEQKNVHNLKEVAGGVPLPPRQLTTSCPEEYGVYGRDIDKEEIFKKLQLNNADGDEICVVPIVGMGGVGKTTLARLVYNDNRVKENFDLKAWICVSDTFDGSIIAKTILEEITLSNCDIHSLNLLQIRIRESLKGKKFLLVLDDVWNEEYIAWDKLVTMLRCGAKEIKIIITTRSENVATTVQPISIHHLMQLSDEECWLLFAKHAFKNVELNSDKELIGRKIVCKCKGLPLAAKALGGMLQSKQDLGEWNHILESDIWDLPEGESSILPALRLSYNYLPSHLKQCFTYCAIFPKDYEFSKEELVLLWMAEDLLLKPKGNGSMEEIGEQYFNELISRSFFQRSNNDEPCFIMHDLFNDLAKFISREFCFRLEIDNSYEITKKMRHLSYFRTEFDVPKKFEVSYEAKNLRTFLGLKLPSASNFQCNNISTMEVNNFLCIFKCLRALSLSLYGYLAVLPDSIGSLKHLRYLNLNGTDIKGLPDSVCGLYNLQTLLLRNCRFLQDLPTNLGRLVNLRHLDIRGTRLKGMPRHMGKLRSLQNLSDFYVGKGEHSGSNIKELGELPHLSGSLCVSDLENVCQTRDAKEVNLKNKKGLSELGLKWERDHENYDSERERDVLEQLCPHTNLKSLSIISYYGAEYPSWLGACSFSNMVSLELDDCRYCSSLPPLGQLPTLEKLSFERMLEWKEWFTNEGGVFPNLRELRIIECPKLTGNLPSLLPSLSVIEIRDCPQLVASLPSPSALHELALTNCDMVVLKELSPKLQSLGIGGCHVTLLEGGLPTTLKTLEINGVLQLPGGHYYPSIESLKVNKGPGSLWSLPLEFFPKLKSIEIRDSDNLESLSASDKSLLDLPSLTNLTIQSCPNFVSFPSGGLCAPNLTQISISHCEKLKSLAEGMHTLLPSLLYLKLMKCSELESFPEGGLPSNLQILEISWCDKLFLRRMEWGLQSLHSLREIIISDHGRGVGSFPEEALLPPSLICLNISFPQLTSLNGRGFQHLTLLKQLEIWVCDEFQSLPEEGFPASLSILDIYECPLLKKRYRRKNGKEWRKISHIPIIRIDNEVIT
ncbi:putative disease resistance protein At3g14460 [Quercus robur]|uniref:putative disease resistance protein At3g14460 n=1 Tax=Quercus robur TaxID=38942 RepID=UPI002163BF5C|nr:putative disease resistance protein At3g14460 [Quercus robur]XP_050283257.1 putative disease resistance protein At3g14460 [Quercus robur]XP_050283258.1 putative disease resistance protein At3g14460 [Quercus robur]XP_050283259.1 putative disease resistance protein At3g14460 [Quercus robur]XP_050283260.1 putative disease resistance protein At3g14460 [Quercus robur]XP_050283261.1 putative disease resistance protein At3g14460 [Quercus robur]XP_050283262.1 putative disease resistance protein At